MAKPVLRKPKKKVCAFCKDKASYIDYKDTALLRKFISDRGKIRARRVTGNCSQHQRDVLPVDLDDPLGVQRVDLALRDAAGGRWHGGTLLGLTTVFTSAQPTPAQPTVGGPPRSTGGVAERYPHRLGRRDARC